MSTVPPPGGEARQQTVQVRVQVVDLRSFTLDLVVPTYLPARDLTQRIARDAGLESHWRDGRRRLYWLRARGRLLGEDERLGDLGIVPGELVYLLPEPPAGSGVEEQAPDHPATRGYPAKGILALTGAILVVVAWSLGWGTALTVDRSLPVVMLPGLGLGFLTTSVARHAWGGLGVRVRVVLTGLVLFLSLAALTFVVPVAMGGEDPGVVLVESIPGVVAGLAGVILGWTAWWGAVEPLSRIPTAALPQAQVVATVPCAICGQEAAPEVRMECPHRCGHWFHVGCHQARVSVYRGDRGLCAVCGKQVG